MQVVSSQTRTSRPAPAGQAKIGNQDYPANPSLDEWAKTAEFETVPEFFRMAVQKNPDGRYVGGKVDKDYQFSTYRETEQKVERFASALISAGIQPTDRVAAFAENSPDWRVADFGISYTGAILTCCLADYTPERVEYVLKDSGSKMIMVDSKERLDAVLGAESRLPDLKTIIVTGNVDLSSVKSEKQLVSLKDFMASGEANLETNRSEMESRIAAGKYNDIGSIVYTSGSTGNPKGVLLSHGNVLSSVEGILKTINNNPEEGLKSARRDDLYASILPLGHVMGRVADYALTAEGGAIAYPGNLVNFAKDLKDLKPSVPGDYPALPAQDLRQRRAQGHDQERPGHPALRGGPGGRCGRCRPGRRGGCTGRSRPGRRGSAVGSGPGRRGHRRRGGRRLGHRQSEKSQPGGALPELAGKLQEVL